MDTPACFVVQDSWSPWPPYSAQPLCKKGCQILPQPAGPRGGESTNPGGNPSLPPIPRTVNAAAFHILPGPLTLRAQTPADPSGPGRCQRAPAVPQAAPRRGHPKPAPVSGAGRRQPAPGLARSAGAPAASAAASAAPPARPPLPPRRQAGRGARGGGSRTLIGRSRGGRGGGCEGAGSGCSQLPRFFPSASVLAAPALHHLQPATAVGRLGAARHTQAGAPALSPAPLLALSTPASAPRSGALRGPPPKTRGTQLADVASSA